MKAKHILPAVLVAASLLLCACGTDAPFTNPGDYLGGGGTVEEVPSATVSDNAANAEDTVGEVPAGEEAVPAEATTLTAGDAISAAGDYLVTGAFDGKLSITAPTAHLYLQNAALTNAKKVIESAGDLTITLLGENTVTNTNADGSNAIDCAGTLTINGTGSLSVTATKNGVSANSIAVRDATLTVNAAKDGLHAEIGAYDDLTAAPTFSYGEGGWVVLDGATLTATTTGDGIQADTFVLIGGESKIDITTNGGAPKTITETSSDSGSGKGIKAGAIDWGADGNEIVSDDYLIAIEGGTLNINANDDAIHSDGEIVLSGGTLNIAAGDDAIHAEALLTVAGGSAEITRCYEGLEAAKVEISGGNVFVNAADDGVNASDGSANKDRNNPNCHIVISGGFLEVSAEGDGIDSNGSMRISGGAVYVSGPTNGGNAALDSNGGILVDGGYLFAVGPVGMVETPAQNSAQNIVSFAKEKDIAAGTNLTLTDQDGNAIFYYTPRKKCRSVIISCPELQTGSEYAIYGGNSSLCTFTVTSRITTVGSSGGIGNPGGFPGGGGMPPGGGGMPPGGGGFPGGGRR